MSFILDALKKSQATRQQQMGPGTISVEAAPSARQPHNWLGIVVAIAVVNLIVIGGVIYWAKSERSEGSASVPTPQQSQTNQQIPSQVLASQAQTTQPSTAATHPIATQSTVLASQSTSGPIAEQTNPTVRGEVRRLSAEVKTSTPGASAAPSTTSETQQVSARNTGSSVTSNSPVAANANQPVIRPPVAAHPDYLPSLSELLFDKRIAVSPLHIDVHVYNEVPQRRFVLINSRKYKEGERLTEGPLLEEIRRDGLVMYYRGQRFLVPRE